MSYEDTTTCIVSGFQVLRSVKLEHLIHKNYLFTYSSKYAKQKRQANVSITILFLH